MRSAVNMLCEPSPVVGRLRNNVGTPPPQVNLSHGLSHWWIAGAESFKDYRQFTIGDGLHTNLVAQAGAYFDLTAGAGRFPTTIPLLLNGVDQYADIGGVGDNLHYIPPSSGAIPNPPRSATLAAWCKLTGAGLSPIQYPILSLPGHYSLYTTRGVSQNARANFTYTRADGRTYTVSSPRVISFAGWFIVFAWYDYERDEVGISIGAGAPTRAGGAAGGTYSPTNFFVGKDGSNFWNGLIEQVARWDRVLNDAERNALVGAWTGNSMLEDILSEPPPPTTPVNFFAASAAPPSNYSLPSALPAVPSGLTAINLGAPLWQLEWNNEAVNALGIEIWRSVEGAAWALAYTANAYRENTWTDYAYEGDSDRIAYKIRAVNFAGASAFTAEVLAEPPGGGTFLTMSGDNFQTMSGSNIATQNTDP